jgi:hypothetical protein
MHHHNQFDKIRLVGVVTISMVLGLLVTGRQAFAQSSDSSSVDVSNTSPDDPANSSDVKSLIVDVPDVSSASDDATTANGAADSTAAPMDDSSDVDYAPSADATGADEASDSASEDSAVLEIPQIVNLANRGRANVPADEASANPDSPVDEASANPDDNDNDQTALSSRDEDDANGEGDLAETGSRVGTLADYQNRAAEAPPAVIFFAPPVAVVRIPPPRAFNPWRRPFGAPMVGAPIILPPTSSGPFPSTSPMLAAPRFGTAGSFPRLGSFPRFGSFPSIGSFPRAGMIGARR